MQFANMLVLSTVLAAAVAPALLAHLLMAQTASSKGMDPDLLARANAGDATSQYMVAFAYQNGVGVPKDLAQAFK
jgi:TPR repeat protein